MFVEYRKLLPEIGVFLQEFAFLIIVIMSTVISLDDAVMQLSEMFPSFDTDVLRMVITESGI